MAGYNGSKKNMYNLNTEVWLNLHYFIGMPNTIATRFRTNISELYLIENIL